MKEIDDMCSCSNCGWQGKTDECDTEQECESWELPEMYTIWFCPVCEDGGCIDNFWRSDEN